MAVRRLLPSLRFHPRRRAILLRRSFGQWQDRETRPLATALDSKYGLLYAELTAQAGQPESGPHAFTVMKPVLPESKAVELSRQGFRCLEQRRIDDAIKVFGKAIDADPKYVESYYGRGIAFRKEGGTFRQPLEQVHP